jgi:hypothetical protein
MALFLVIALVVAVQAVSTTFISRTLAPLGLLFSALRSWKDTDDAGNGLLFRWCRSGGDGGLARFRLVVNVVLVAVVAALIFVGTILLKLLSVIVVPMAAIKPSASIVSLQLLLQLLFVPQKAIVVTAIAIVAVELSWNRGMLSAGVKLAVAVLSLLEDASVVVAVMTVLMLACLGFCCSNLPGTTGFRLLQTWHRRLVAGLRRVHVPQVQHGFAIA